MNFRLTRSLIATAALTFSAFLPQLPAQEEIEVDPYEWIIETYSFPAHELVRGFATEERGALVAPEIPEADMTEEEMLEFLRKSNSVVSHYLKEQGLALPEGSVVIFDPVSLSLAARVPQITQSSISFTSAAFREGTATFVELHTVLLEGEADTVREQLKRAGELADHSDLLAELETAVPQGSVSILQQGRIETRSGQRTKLEASKEFAAAAELALTPDGMTLYESETYREGTSWEIDTVVGADNITIDLNLSLNHHVAPSKRWQIPFTTAEEGLVSSAITESSIANVTSQYTLSTGTTKMVGVWKPQSVPGGANDPDKLQAGFISADVIEVLPLPNPKLAEILEKHADSIEKIPEGNPVFEKVAEEIPDGMIVRRFRIPPTFLSGSRAGNSSATDPFADVAGGEPTFTIRATVKDILMSAGIPFPAGSSANYLSGNSTLVVRNIPENIALVEAYVMSISSGIEKAIGFTAYLVEGPAEKIRNAISETRGLANHIGAWESVSADEEITQLSSYWIEGRSGQRCKVEMMTDFYFPVANHIVTQDPKEGKEGANHAPVGTLSGYFDRVGIGTSFEVDPILGADETTIDLNYAILHDFAQPETTPEPERKEGDIELEGPQTEFHRASVTSSTTIRDGMTRLVGFWKPEGDPRFEQADLLQAVFLKVDVIPVREEE